MSPTVENPFVRLKQSPERETELKSTDRFPAAGHLWIEEEIDALTLAYAARRPLLVRGEAGSGKSQIARAAAEVLGTAPPLVEVIHPRFEALDLLYQVDTVARLADAQVNTLDRTNERYVTRGRLWEAMAAADAALTSPVLLIDEIDKADADVPNALLDVLGNRSFTVPPLHGRVVRLERGRMPLIVITTNEERELPPAFVRRCVVLNLNPPQQDDAFVDWLKSRGRVHGHLRIEEQARDHAARQVRNDRRVAVDAGYPAVGLAEYIDLLTAVHELTDGLDDGDRRDRQLGLLQTLSAYALVKHAGQNQRRSPEPLSASAPDADAPS